MKTPIYIFVGAVVSIAACTKGSYTASTPAIEPTTEKAREYNYNYNQAKNIVNYTTKHKKTRQKISEQNRQIQNDNWHRLNSTNKNPDKRHQSGQFRFYRNN